MATTTNDLNKAKKEPSHKLGFSPGVALLCALLEADLLDDHLVYKGQPGQEGSAPYHSV